MPSMFYQFGRFINQVCQNSRMEHADLLVKRANQTRFLGRLMANHSQRVKVDHLAAFAAIKRDPALSGFIYNKNNLKKPKFNRTT